MEQQPAIQFYVDKEGDSRAHCRYRDWDSRGHPDMVHAMIEAGRHLLQSGHPQTMDKEE